MAVRISRWLLDGILAQAAAEPDREVCGLLLGTTGEIEHAVPTANVATEPATRFEIDPAALIAAHRDARGGGGLTVIGHYHSHPSGASEPSAADAADARPDGALWLIIAQGQAQLWRAGTDGLHHRFVAEPLVVHAP